jgi:hypothetical protein
LFVSAGILTASALLLTLMPKYRYGVGADVAVSAAPTPQSA